jgi:phosphoribosylaminoimidazolecarboxamide formyltransferase / IMP cyclohydrolase
MSEPRKIKSALISVFYKDNLEPVVRTLHQLGVTIYSTGGTEAFIRKLNIPVTPVENITNLPSAFGGRVKTLHPAVFGGILARRDEIDDLNDMAKLHISEIDLVIVDLYPFEETVAKEKVESEIIEKIDIGGVALIRAAAKNYKFVTVISSRDYYTDFLNLLNEKQGKTDLEDRKLFAAKAFNITSNYDTAIFNYFNKTENIPAFKQSILHSETLRYGENPHQHGIFYGSMNDMLEKLSGKELSYNNLVDMDSAIELIKEFSEPTFVIIKHTNACGAASAKDLSVAYDLSLAADPVSAFGGILACNGKIDLALAEKINSLFFEVLIAPEFDTNALDLLTQKKNRILVKLKSFSKNDKVFKSILNGVIEQDKDNQLATKETIKHVTNAKPTDTQIEDLLFAEIVTKHLKSNTITLVKNKQLIAMGCGQTSRIDSLKQAIAKAKAFGFDVKGSVMGSDAFFPFSDCVELAYSEGVAAIIQPGGSVRDKDSIAFCNDHNLPMVFTGLRHFKH